MDTDDEAPQSLSKRPRASKPDVEDEADVETPAQSSPPPEDASPPAEEVKEVTKGVKTIDLEPAVASTLPSETALTTSLPKTRDVSEAPAAGSEPTKADSEELEKVEEVSSKESAEDAVVGETADVPEEQCTDKSPEEQEPPIVEALAHTTKPSSDVSGSIPESQAGVESPTQEKYKDS